MRAWIVAALLAVLAGPALAQSVPQGCRPRPNMPLSDEMKEWCSTHTPSMIATRLRLQKELQLHTEDDAARGEAADTFRQEAATLRQSRSAAAQDKDLVAAIDELLRMNAAALARAQQ